jgi:hypothetical protein
VFPDISQEVRKSVPEGYPPVNRNPLFPLMIARILPPVSGFARPANGRDANARTGRRKGLFSGHRSSQFKESFRLLTLQAVVVMVAVPALTPKAHRRCKYENQLRET